MARLARPARAGAATGAWRQGRRRAPAMAPRGGSQRDTRVPDRWRAR